MESLILITPAAYSQRELVDRVSFSVEQEQAADGGTVFRRGGRRIYLRAAPEVATELPGEVLAELRDQGWPLMFWLLDFSDLQFCKDLVLSIANDPKIVVDNDHGIRLRGDDFVALLRSRPAWDWRVERPSRS
jgi:hypothetical protein